MEQDQRRPDLLGSLFMILATMVLAWMAWHLMVRPSWPRLRASLLRSSARVTSALARRTAALSMRRELSWGYEDYRVPYRLATLSGQWADAARAAEREMQP